MSLKIKNEILRKLIHLTSLWIPILYVYLERSTMLFILVICIGVFVPFDYYRHINPVAKKVFSIFNMLLRDFEQEKHSLTGASYVLLSSLILVAFFPKVTVIVALVILIIADSFAAIIGKIYGKTALFTKTLEGTTAFFISGLLSGFLVLFFFKCNYHYYFIHIFVMVVAALVELFSRFLKIDDNFSIPISVALVMSLLHWIM